MYLLKLATFWVIENIHWYYSKLDYIPIKLLFQTHSCILVKSLCCNLPITNFKHFVFFSDIQKCSQDFSNLGEAYCSTGLRGQGKRCSQKQLQVKVNAPSSIYLVVPSSINGEENRRRLSRYHGMNRIVTYMLRCRIGKRTMNNHQATVFGQRNPDDGILSGGCFSRRQ